MLPPGAVRELKASREVRPRRYEEVAVLFSDIVGFTRYCDENPPEKVVGELQALVAAFEDIVQAHGLEKIKTVGDAFLATAGLLNHLPDPVLASVTCGLEMVAASRRLEPNWEVRVGIQFGPVAAGIIGRRQYGFDLWGDTVNTAARIMQRARPGSVCLSADSWQHVRSRCRGTSQGFVELKGKGSIELIECQALR